MVFQSLYTTFQIVCQNFSDETGKWKKPSLLLMFLLRFMHVVKVISLCPSFMVFALFWSFYMLRQSIIVDSIWFLLKIIIIIIIITKPKVFIILN
jgi:fumarate reductase subunit C